MSTGKKSCLDRGSNTGPLDLQSNALPTELSKQVTITERSTCGLEWFADSQKKKCQNRSLIAGLAPMVSKNKKPTGGIEPPTFRLQSECSTTKLSRRTRVISNTARPKYRNPPIAQLAERETVDGYTTVISRSLVRIRVGGHFFCPVSCLCRVCGPWLILDNRKNTKTQKRKNAKTQKKKGKNKNKNDRVPINETT